MSKDTLYNLIQTLSKSEKRKFRMELYKYRTSKSGHLILLFDLYNNIKDFDEEKLDTAIKDAKFSINPTYDKHRLQKKLVSYIGSINDNSILKKLQNLWIQVLALYSKRQFELALKYADQGIKVAKKESSNFFFYLFVNEKINISQELPKLNASKQLQLINQSIESENLYHMKHVYTMLYQKAECLVNQINSLPEPEISKGINEITNSVYFKDESLALDNYCKEYLYDVKSNVYNYKENYNKELEYRKKTFDIYSQYENIPQEAFFNYVASGFNYISVLIKLGKIRLGRECLEVIGEMVVKNKDRVDKFVNSTYEINKDYFELDFSSRCFEASEVVKNVSLNQDLINQKISSATILVKNDFYDLIIANYFGAGQFEEVIIFQNEYAELLKGNCDKQCFYNVKLYTFLANYELGNLRVLQSLFDAFYYFCRQNGFEKQRYKEVFKILRKLCNNPPKELVSELCQNSLKEYEKIGFFKRHHLNYLLCWMKSKANKINLSEAVELERKNFRDYEARL